MRASTFTLAPLRPAFRAVWLATLGLLLAFHAAVSMPTATAFAQDGWRVAKFTASAPLAAQFRESGQTLQVARASALSFKAHDASGDGNPFFPGNALAFAPPARAAGASQGLTPSTLLHANIRDAYHARAPPADLPTA